MQLLPRCIENAQGNKLASQPGDIVYRFLFLSSAQRERAKRYTFFKIGAGEIRWNASLHVCNRQPESMQIKLSLMVGDAKQEGRFNRNRIRKI